MAKLTVNGLAVHYQRAGQGPDVVLVHGITGDLSGWYVHFLPGLAQRYRVLTYDLRGHGLSDMPPTGYDTATLAQDLVALLDALGIGTVRLVGHSQGGAIALAAAARWPGRVDSVVLYDAYLPALKRLHMTRGWPGWAKHGPTLATVGITPESDFDDHRTLIERVQSLPPDFGMRRGLTRANRRMLKLIRETPALAEAQREAGLTEEALGALRTPVLAIYCDGSPAAPIGRWLGEHLPDCRLVWLAHEDHFFVLQEPERFLAPTLDFLDERGRGARPAATGAETPCTRA